MADDTYYMKQALMEAVKAAEQGEVPVGAVVVTCRRGGNTATFDVLNKYFTMTGMPVASSQYWNMVYGGSAEEVAQDAEGLQTMRTLGRNMAFMMKSFQLGKEQIGLPQKEPLIFTNFHR